MQDDVHILYVDADNRSAGLFRGRVPVNGRVSADLQASPRSACEALISTPVYNFVIVSLDSVSTERPDLLHMISHEASLIGAVVIFLTDRDNSLGRALAASLRSDTFMVKPTSPRELDRFVRFLTAAAGLSAAQPDISPVGMGNGYEPIELLAA